MKTEAHTFATSLGTVSGLWNHANDTGTYLVLAHGAGGNMHTPGLKSYAEAMAARGVGTLRFNFVYAEMKKKAPDRTAKLEECYRAVATAVSERARTVYLGGRSMGGRIGSHLAAQGFPTAGLVFLAYPLHPPGKPEKIRDAHLFDVSAPMLFLQGTRDAFADPELLAKTIASLPRATLHSIESADHSHKVSGRAPADVTDELVAATLRWMER